MKKYLYLIFAFILFSPVVSYAKLRVPEDVYIKPQYEDVRGNVKEIIEKIGEDRFNKAISDIVSEYNSKYSKDYPYYYISVYRGGGSVYQGSESGLTIRLFFHDKKLTGSWSGFYPNGSSSLSSAFYDMSTPHYIYYFFHMRSDDLDYRLDKVDYFSSYVRGYSFNFCNGKYESVVSSDCYALYDYDYVTQAPFIMVSLDGDTSDLMDKNNSDDTYDYSLSGVYLPYMYYYSNYDFVVPAPKSGYQFNGTDLGIKTSYFELISNIGKYRVISSNERFKLDTYVNSIAPSEDVLPPDYVEINLNNYAYVALVPKDYSSVFSSSVYVKGQYCITPLYDYGRKSYDEVTGRKVQNTCSPYYSSFTSVTTSINQSDIDNHAIYYVKAYDSSRENILRVNSSHFDVSLISESEKNSPKVSVSGTDYNTLPFDNLPSSANQNYKENYVPGESENFFEGIIDGFVDFFSSIGSVFAKIPSLIDVVNGFLNSVEASITAVIGLITTFIAMLPEPMQNFLYCAFTIAIVIAIIKIIL